MLPCSALALSGPAGHGCGALFLLRSPVNVALSGPAGHLPRKRGRPKPIGYVSLSRVRERWHRTRQRTVTERAASHACGGGGAARQRRDGEGNKNPPYGCYPIRRVIQALKRGPSFLGPLLDYQKAPNVAPSGAFSSRKGIRVDEDYSAFAVVRLIWMPTT